jgi:hypothetical protein
LTPEQKAVAETKIYGAPVSTSIPISTPSLKLNIPTYTSTPQSTAPYYSPVSYISGIPSPTLNIPSNLQSFGGGSISSYLPTTNVTDILKNPVIDVSKIQAPITPSFVSAVNDTSAKANNFLTAMGQYQTLLQQQQEQMKTWYEESQKAIAGRPKLDIATIQKQLQEQYGIPANYSQLQSISPEIVGLTQQLAGLTGREQQALLTSEQRLAPMTFIRGEQSLIQRNYANQRMALSAELSAKTAVAEMYRGNISLAQSLVSNAVNSMVYNYNQQIDDWNLFYNLYGDYIKTIDSTTQDALNKSYNELIHERDGLEEDYNYKLNLQVDAAGKGIDLGWTIQQIQTMSKEEATGLYSEAMAKISGVSVGWTNAENYIQENIKANTITPQNANIIAPTIYATLKKGTNLTDSDLKALLGQYGVAELNGMWSYTPTWSPTGTTITPSATQTTGGILYPWKAEFWKEAQRELKETFGIEL